MSTQIQSPLTLDLLRDALQHHLAGRLDEAELIYRQILKIDDAHSDTLHLSGMIAHRRGNNQRAVELIRKAIALSPAQAPYYANLGTILYAQGQFDEAALALEWALALDPDLAEVHNNLGNIFQTQNKLEAAVACFERALILNPQCAEALSNLGIALQAQDKREEAVAAYKRALAIRPNYGEAWSNLGNALQAQGHLHDSLQCYESALSANPNDAKAHQNLGCALFSLGRLEEALVQHRRARELQPDYADARLSESLAQLSQGNFAEGWSNYEARWHTKDHQPPMREYTQPLWAGETLKSGRLFIWGEQGIGDEIMFGGLLPEVVAAGNRCVLACDPRLQPLFARSFRGVEVISGEPNLTEIAAHLPIGTLPSLFRRSHSSFASTTSPYLLPDPIRRAKFRGHMIGAHDSSGSHGTQKAARPAAPAP